MKKLAKLVDKKNQPLIKKKNEFKVLKKDKVGSLNGWIILFLLIWIVLAMKLFTLGHSEQIFVLKAYSIAIIAYIYSRLILSYFYEIPEDNRRKNSPTVSIIVPCKNEEENIGKTIEKLSTLNYPKSKLEVFIINDGSTDNTLLEIKKAITKFKKNGPEFNLINWKQNRGKREGLAAGIKKSKGKFLIVVDSDSFIDENAINGFVKYFDDPKVGAVSAHTDVHNHDTNILTKMQDVRYWISFKVQKSAEALFGTVTCCPGCCSAYRREYVIKIIDEFLNQKFLGAQSTYGDDRSLTNFMLSMNYKCLYAPDVKAHTIVPDTWDIYLKQQLRWKKSWTKETLKACTFMWTRNPIASISFYLGLVLTLVAPVIIILNLFWLPVFATKIPSVYLLGLAITTLIYAIYFHNHNVRKGWFLGALFIPVTVTLLVWQLPWALMNLRDTKWGTR